MATTILQKLCLDTKILSRVRIRKMKDIRNLEKYWRGSFTSDFLLSVNPNQNSRPKILEKCSKNFDFVVYMTQNVKKKKISMPEKP